MNISPISLFNININSCNKPKPCNNFSNLKSLAKDTVSFNGKPKISPELKEAIKCEDYKNILDILGFETFKNSKGKLEIYDYEQPDEDTTFADYGINEQKMFNAIKKFNGETNLKNSAVTKLGKQEFNYLNIENSKVNDLGNAKIGVLALNPEQSLNLKFDKADIEDLYIMEKDDVADKFGELIQKASGDLMYFPGTEHIFKLKIDV